MVRGALGGARIAQIGLGIVVAGFGWLFTLGLDGESTLGSKILVGVMTGFFALIAGVLFWVALVKSSPNRSPLVRALRERPEDVVWVYEQEIKVDVDGIAAPVTNTNVIARLADGSTVAITVNKAKAPELVNALTMLAPRATVGWSDAREAQFARDPRSVSVGAG